MLRRLKSEWYLIVFSLAVALALWAFVTSKEVAFQRRTLTVPLEVTNIPPGMTCVRKPEKVTITVVGPREGLPALRRRVKAHVNASRLGPGLHLLQVRVSLPAGFKLLSVTPERARVAIDRLMRKEMEVRVAFLGAPPEGSRVVGMRIDPPKVVVEGPASKVSAAKVAVVLLDSPSGSAVEVKAPVRVLDEDYLPVRGLKVSPSLVSVRISLRPAFASKTLPVHPRVVGYPAEGFEVAGVEVSPNFVTVSGRPEALRRLRFVRTRPVDISGAQGDVVRRTILLKPPGVDTLSMESVTVVVRIRRKPSPERPPQPEGKPLPLEEKTEGEGAQPEGQPPTR